MLLKSQNKKSYSRIANKLPMAQKRPKTYWSLLKLFLNNKRDPHYTTPLS